MAGWLKTTKWCLRGLLILNMALPHPARAQSSWTNTAPLGAAAPVFQNYYSSLTLNELLGIDLDSAELTRRSLYWGTPGSTQTPPSSNELRDLEQRILRWKNSLDTHLPALLSTQHPSGDAEISRLSAEVVLYFQAVKSLELVKHLNRSGTPLESWMNVYGLRIPISYNGDYEFIIQMAQFTQQQHSNDAPLVRAALSFESEPLLTLSLEDSLIEEFEMKAMGRFQASDENTVEFIQFTTASFLFDNLAEVLFLQGQNPDYKSLISWLDQFPVLRHKTRLWEDRLNQRRWQFVQKNLLQPRFYEFSAPLLKADHLGGGLTAALASDLCEVWQCDASIRSEQESLLKNGLQQHIENRASDIGVIMPSLLSLWNPRFNSGNDVSFGQDLKALSLEALNHVLRYSFIFTVESIVPNAQGLEENEYDQKIHQLKTLWSGRIDAHLARLSNEVSETDYAEIEKSLKTQLAGGSENQFRSLYVNDLIRQSELTTKAIQDGRLNLSVLTESMQGLFAEKTFSTTVLESLALVTSQSDYFSSRNYYFGSVLGPTLPSNLQALNVLNGADVDPRKLAAEIETQMSASNLSVRKKNLLDLIQAGEWFGFFSHQALDAAEPQVEQLTALPQHIRANYLERLELLVGSLHPILSTKVLVASTRPTSGSGRLAYNVSSRTELMKVLVGLNPTQAEPYVLEALEQTHRNILSYLEIVKSPYNNPNLIGQFFGQKAELKPEFLSVVRYSTMLKNHFQNQPGMQAASEHWLAQQDKASELSQVWHATESFLFDKALWVILAIDLVGFIARWSPAGRLGSALGWFHSSILAPVFGVGSKWLHRALLVGIGVMIGTEVYQVVSEYNTLATIESMLHTSSGDEGLTDFYTYANQLEKANATSQDFLIKMGFLAVALTALMAIMHYVPKFIASRGFAKISKNSKDLLARIGLPALSRQTTRHSLEAAYSASMNSIMARTPHLKMNELMQIKYKMAGDFKSLMQSLNAEAKAWEARLRSSYSHQIDALYLNNARFLESLGYNSKHPLTSDMIEESLKRFKTYADNGQISHIRWSQIQDSGRQLSAAVRQREQVWGNALLFGDDIGVYAQEFGAYSPEVANAHWKETGASVRFEMKKVNGMEIFTPVRTDIPRPPRIIIWKNLLEGPPKRQLLEYIRQEPFSL